MQEYAFFGLDIYDELRDMTAKRALMLHGVCAFERCPQRLAVDRVHMCSLLSAAA
jgi:hypothetical protein